MKELAYLDKADLDVLVSRDMFLQLFSQVQGGQGDPEMMAGFGAMIFDQYVARLRGAGVTTQDNGDAALKASYADGKIDMNGESISPEEFAQRFIMTIM